MTAQLSWGFIITYHLRNFSFNIFDFSCQVKTDGGVYIPALPTFSNFTDFVLRSMHSFYTIYCTLTDLIAIKCTVTEIYSQQQNKQIYKKNI